MSKRMDVQARRDYLPVAGEIQPRYPYFVTVGPRGLPHERNDQKGNRGIRKVAGHRTYLGGCTEDVGQ